MPPLSTDEFLDRLAKRKPVPAILLLGADAYLRELCRSKLVDAFVPEAARAWAVQRFSLRETDLAQILQQAQTLPMLAERQVIFVEDLDRAEGWGEEKRDAFLAELVAYLENPAPFTVLVFEAEALDQRMKLTKFLMAESLVVAAELPESDRRAGDRQKLKTAVALTLEMARERGIEIERPAAERLADVLDCDLAHIRTELEKLACYCGDQRKITVADVDALVISAKSYEVWKLAGALAEGRRAEGLAILENLLRHGESAPGMVGALAWMYRKLIEAQQLPAHLNKWQLAGKLRMNADAAELAHQNARRVPRKRLLGGLVALYEADNRLKSGATDDRAILEFLLARLIPNSVANRRQMG